MISWWSEFQTLSRGFMRFHHACMFCFLHLCWILWLRCLSPAACQYGFPAARPNLCALSWSRQKKKPEELGKFLLPARRAEHEVRRDDDRSTNNRCGLSRLLFRPLVETFPNFLEGLFWDLHALQVGLALEWIFGRHNLFETSLLHHLRLGTWNCHPFSESFPLRWVFEHWISDASNILQSVSATRKSGFQILPANNAYPRTIAGETFFYQIGGALTGPSQRLDDIQALRQTVWSGLQLALQIAVHKVFSHLPRGLGHFEDNSSIPQNQTTTFRPSLISTDVPLLYALSQQSHSFLICVVLTYSESVTSLHRIFQIPMNCQCKWLSASLMARKTFLNACPSSEKCFCHSANRFLLRHCLVFLVLFEERNTSITTSQRSTVHTLSTIQRNDSDSVELCETEVCFLHIQLTGTKVRLPKIRKTPPEVDFESSRSPAKSESWNKPSLQCCAVFPTWQNSR